MDDSFLYKPPPFAQTIWSGSPPGLDPGIDQNPPTIAPYLIRASNPSPAVVVLPGGGYSIKAAHEAIPIAQWLNSLGISAFVLDYRVAPYRHPIPMIDARRAIQYVRSKAEDWSIDAQRVAILGFSAGGHLASTTGTHFETIDNVKLPEDEISKYSFRPNAMILCYPVISFSECGHMGSMQNLLGNAANDATRRWLSNELQVTTQTPPSFIWHTADDETVPVDNSLQFARALSSHSIPFDLHIFSHGIHGIGLAQGHPFTQSWTGLCAHWLASQGFTNAIATR